MLSYKIYVVSGLFNQKSFPCLKDTNLISPAAGRLRDWWWREAENGIPRRSRFDIIDHFDAAPDFFLVEVLGEGAFRTRIIGEQAKAHVEADRTGSVIRRDNPHKFLQVLWEHYSDVVARREPVMCNGYVEYDKHRRCLYEGLDCPLSSDGTVVTHIIGILTVFQDAAWNQAP